MAAVDLNCDMGELDGLHQDGTQRRLMRFVSSVNIACGAHAGDEQLMAATVADALAAGMAIGAHPGYPNRENFGRIPLDMSAAALRDTLIMQLRALGALAQFTYVKPHGALYNVAVNDRAVARTIAEAVVESGVKNVVGLAGSPMLDEFARCGLRPIAEAFADRRYEPDGTLRSRKLNDSVLTEAQEAADQVLSIFLDGMVTASDGSRIPIRADTICLHSDTPGSLRHAEHIHAALVRAGITIHPV